MRTPALLLAALLLGGCGIVHPRSAASSKRLDEQELLASAKADNKNPWPHYGLARIYEARGNYEKAIFHFGACINRLPPRSATRPALELGILQQRLGNDGAARNCYREVLETFPSDTQLFHTNPDFRLAALGLAYSLKDMPNEADDVKKLEQRYLKEFRGDPKYWLTRPPWMDEPLKRPRGG